MKFSGFYTLAGVLVGHSITHTYDPIGLNVFLFLVSGGLVILGAVFEAVNSKE